MQICLHFVLFEELQEKPNGSGALAHIAVIRESKNSGFGLEEDTAGFHPLE